MSKSKLKPALRELVENIEQYRFSHNGQISDLEFDILTAVCISADRAIRVVSKTALEHVSQDLKHNFIPHLSADDNPGPMATMVGNNDAFRISIPISFVHRLIEITPTRNGRRPVTESDYFCQSVLVAILAAYAHELTHVFNGHLPTTSSIAQETNADYIGGGIVWRWLHRPDIQKICQVQSLEVEPACAFGFLHLISILNDADHGESIYLPRAARLQTYGGGAAFCADKTSDTAYGDRMQTAMMNLPMCPAPEFQSAEIENTYRYLDSQSTEDMKNQIVSALEKISREKRHWYDASVHLRPIKRDLQRILKWYSRKRS